VHAKAIYQVLNKRKFKHPNLLRCILAIPEGKFLERLTITVEFRNRNREKELVSQNNVIQAIQFLSAETYLKELRYVHNDLQPANVLPTKEDHTKQDHVNFAISTLPSNLASGFEQQPQDSLKFAT
jgi:serine/threonine protein kinase